MASHNNHNYTRALSVFLLIAVILFYSSGALAHAFPFGEEMGALNVGISLSYDSRDEALGTGLNMNLVFLFFNVGVGYRHWDKRFVGWNDEGVRDEFIGNIGLGIGRLLQIKPTISNAGFRLQARSELLFFSDDAHAGIADIAYPSDCAGKWGPFRKGVILAPSLETDFDRTLFGIEVGLFF